MDANIPRILNFWFEEHSSEHWFIPPPTFDQEIKSNFGDLVHQARTPSLDHWSNNPNGTLALLLLLDQFPRNIFRGTPDAFSSDTKALDVAVKGIAKGYDRMMQPMQQAFFLLPLMHSEQLLAQIAGIAGYEGMAQRCSGVDEKAKGFAEVGLGMAVRHKDAIARFGRFPSRNGILGRESTVEEVEFLKEHPSGF